jgi:hypothetical protein
MPASKDRPTSALRRALDAANSYVGDPAITILSYIPKRRISAAAARPRDLTLPAGFIPPCLPMTAPSAPPGPLWLHEIKHDGFRIIARKDEPRGEALQPAGQRSDPTLVRCRAVADRPIARPDRWPK